MTKRLLENLRARHVLCLMILTGFIFVFMIRVNINIAIVGMVKSGVSRIENDLEETLENANVSLKVINMTEVEEGKFEWDEFQQSLILGSFFYGYMASQVPGGRISELYGIKLVFGIGVLMNGLLSLAIPFSARLHWILLFLIRVLQGLAQGVMYPALNACVGKWVPINERARFMSITVQGCSIGPVITIPLCGWILTTWGWPAVFYTTGTMAVIWYGFWLYLIYDSPEQHPRISREEKNFLKNSLGRNNSQDIHPVPWKDILLSFQFWLGAAAHVGSDWGFHTFYTYGPKYIKEALDFDISQSAILSSLPFLCQYITASIIGIVVDKLLINYRIPIRRIRKVSVFVSHCMPGFLVVILTLIGHNVILSMVVFTSAVSMLGALTTGHYQNPIDIAPNLAGSLTGIANTLGSLGGIFCTTVAGTFLQNYGSPEGWHYIFYVAAVVYGLTSIPFIIWAESKEVVWNRPKSNIIKCKSKTKSKNGDILEMELLRNNLT